jgi:hypothetical protein
MDFIQKSLLFLLLMFASGSALAEACTYREAIMALERGNTSRGIALMRMANRDGDKRAGDYLVMKSYQFQALAIDLPQGSLISLNRVEP